MRDHAPSARCGRVSGPVAVRLEVSKTRRLWIWPVSLVLLVTALALCLPVDSSARAELTAPGDPWPARLLACGMAAALISPLLTAVLASRLTDVEHTGGGWTMAGTAGLTPGRLCRAKTAALSGVLAVVATVQVGVCLLVTCAMGASAPVEWAHWLGFAALLLALDVVSCGWHVLLAARVENQIICVGAGFLGSFIALFTLLMPSSLARLLPWGYWAMIIPAVQRGDLDAGTYRVVYDTPSLPWVLGFLLLAGAGFLAVTARLDRIER